jgi:hypothetical protein
MSNVLEVMWISCFWFLMPGVSVTSQSGGRGRQVGDQDAAGGSPTTRSHSVLDAPAAVAPRRHEPPGGEPETDSARTDITPASRAGVTSVSSGKALTAPTEAHTR